MIPQGENGHNPPDFVESFFSQQREPTSPAFSLLQELNACQFIMDLKDPIVDVEWAHNGLSRQWWIKFESGAVAFIPSTKLLRSSSEMEVILSDTLGRSILLYPPKTSRKWKAVECNLLMQIAKERDEAPGSNVSHLREILSNSYFICTESKHGERLTGRYAAKIFVEQAADRFIEQRQVGVQTPEGLYLHLAALAKVWRELYAAPPSFEDLCATLYRESFVPTNPFPTGHAGRQTGAGEGYTASIRMWFRAEVVAVEVA